MVSSFSNPGFPPVHTRQTAAPHFSSLEDHVASLEAMMASLPSLINAVIEKRDALSKHQEGISAPLATDHHVSPVIEPIQLPWSPICARGAQSQLIPAAIQSSTAAFILTVVASTGNFSC
ncbi:hypothetical protein PS2_006248 [Malus domestica]